MTELMARLRRSQQTGSKPRCHLLTHGTREQVAARLTALIAPFGVVSADDAWMPSGFTDLDEAQLHDAPRLLQPAISSQLCSWWLAVRGHQSRTPNIDLASTCRIGETRGLVLIEAKAHTRELRAEAIGKRLDLPVTVNSRRNHVRIGACIEDASLALSGATGLSWALSRDWNYQMANRFTWAWKLTEMGVPVVLVYLGFLGAREMASQEPGKETAAFETHQHWREEVLAHSQCIVPQDIWDREWTCHGQSFVPLIRSHTCPLQSPSGADDGTH